MIYVVFKTIFKIQTRTLILNDALKTVTGCRKVNTLQKLRLSKN